MTTAVTYADWIAAIRADPDNDALRLQMADWFDERGESDRGEFVRVQVELAKHLSCPKEAANHRCGISAMTRKIKDGELTNLAFPGVCPRCDWIRFGQDLRRRERELLCSFGENSNWTNYAIWAGELVLGIDASVLVEDGWIFRRGFVEVLRLTAADWLTHADAILREPLVREVTLTTWPAIQCRMEEGFCRIAPTENGPWREVQGYRGFDVALAAAAEWPGITFHLPEANHGPSPLRNAYSAFRDAEAIESYLNRQR
jgi:uncharacterized protein (TIGR02996 family)